MKQILDAIFRLQKGHWGLVEPAFGVSIQTEFLHEARRGFRGELLEINCHELPMTSPEVSGAIMSRIKDALKTTRESSKRALCCVLREFHHLGVECQIAALSATRSIRESTFDISLITVVIGSWNRYRIPAAWKQHHPTSPCPDQKCIRAIDPYSVVSLQTRLLEDRWISNPPSEIEEVTIRALLEFTGGDACFLEEVLSTLRMSGSPLRDYSDTLADVTTSETVETSIRQRLTGIGEKAKHTLCSIIRQQRKLVNPRLVDIEDLRLAGLIRIERIGDLDIASISSALMEKALRRNHMLLGCELLSDGTDRDLVSPTYAINSYAYHLVLQIETLLRNAMVEHFCRLAPDGWLQGAKDIKIPGNPAELHIDEIHQLGKKLIAALYPEFDFSGFGGDSNSSNAEIIHPPVNEKKKKPPMLSVVDAALEWRERSTRQSWVRSAENSLPQFMTTGSLMNVYLGKDMCESLLKTCFIDREQAKTFFAQFLSLRSAVAHNHSLGLSVVEDLISLKRDLCNRLGSNRE